MFRLLAVVLEGYKGKNNFISDLSIKGFVHVIRYLFIGTIFQDKILKSLLVHSSDGTDISKQLFNQAEQEDVKDDMSNYSDNDSAVGSTYTDSVGQDILMKAKASACLCLKSFFKFAQKALFNYRY